VRTSTNFVHLATFQAIEFVDWPVRKTLDILYVIQAKKKVSLQNAAFYNITVVYEEQEDDFILIPSFHAFR